MADEYTAAQAGDPGTPGEVLQRIALKRPDLRPIIARNPATYPALLDWLRELGDPEVNAALATRAGASDAPDGGASPITADHAPVAPDEDETTATVARPRGGAEEAVAGSGHATAAGEAPTGSVPPPAGTMPLGAPAAAGGATGPAVAGGSAFGSGGTGGSTFGSGGTGGSTSGSGGTGGSTSGSGGTGRASGSKRRWLWIGVGALVVVLAGGGAAFAMMRGGDKPEAAAATQSATPSDMATPTPTMTDAPSPTPSESASETPTPTPTPTPETVNVVDLDASVPEDTPGFARSGGLMLSVVSSDTRSDTAALAWSPTDPGEITAIPFRLPASPDELKWDYYLGSQDANPYVLRVYETRTPADGLTPEKFHWYADRIDAKTGEVTSSVPIDLSAADQDLSDENTYAVGDRMFVQASYNEWVAFDLTSGQRASLPRRFLLGVSDKLLLMTEDSDAYGVDPVTGKTLWTLSSAAVAKATDSYGSETPSWVSSKLLSVGVGLADVSNGKFEQAGPKLYDSNSMYTDLATGGVLARYQSEGKINGWYMMTAPKLAFDHRFVTEGLANDLDLDIHDVYDGVIYLTTTDETLSVQLDGKVLNWAPWQWSPMYRLGDYTMVCSIDNQPNDPGCSQRLLVKNFTKEMLTEPLVADTITSPYGYWATPTPSPSDTYGYEGDGETYETPNDDQ